MEPNLTLNLQCTTKSLNRLQVSINEILPPMQIVICVLWKKFINDGKYFQPHKKLQPTYCVKIAQKVTKMHKVLINVVKLDF